MVTATRAGDTPATSHLLGDTHTYLTLRVRGSEHDGRVLRIRSPKCVIGSDPDCTLRLDADGVTGVHCLVLRAAEGTFVRRWAAGTTLNGHGFDIARVKSGDCLTVGTVELEFLDPTPCEDPAAPIAPPAPEPATGARTDASEQRYQELQASLEEARQARRRLEEVVAQQRTELANALEGVKSSQAQIAQLRSELSQRTTPPAATGPETAASRAESPRLAAELAEAKDLVLCLRNEMEKQARQHQEASDRWDSDRRALESKVEECTAAAHDLQQYYSHYMEEAELLMQAMQQEGKNLLLELEEARQQARQPDRAAPSPLNRPSDQNAADPEIPREAEGPSAEPHADQAGRRQSPYSACATLVMDSNWQVDELGEAGDADASSDRTLEPSAEAAEGSATGGPDFAGTDDAAAAASPPLRTEVLPEMNRAASGEDADDEHAVERYMERLLRRVAKIPDDVETPPEMVAALQARVTAPPPAHPAQSRIPTTASAPGVGGSAGGGPDGSAATASPSAAAASTDAVINRILKPREPMPQSAADLLAMRALANHTARRAVNRHEYRRGMVRVASQSAVAVVCLASGGVLAALSRGPFTLPMAGGTLGFSFGILLLARSFATFRRLRKLKRQSGQDD